MKIEHYPAVFHPEEVGGYSVSFPDLPGCVTQGDTLDDAVYCAREAMMLYCVGEDTLPEASTSDCVELDDNDLLIFIDCITN